MKKEKFPYVIAIAAFFISASAIFYSVYGLSMLFSGERVAVSIMAGSLEFGKLVVASLLYRYWGEISKLLRFYLTIACFILMLITSGGIYGVLSGAYQETATKSEMMDKEVVMLETKQNRFKEQLASEVEMVKYYTEALSNPTMIQYVDRETGQLITTTSSRQRNLMTSQLKEAKDNVSMLNDSISRYDIKVLNTEISNESSRELGPLKYISKSTGLPMDVVVNYFLLLIVFVFDPLAISLVIAANFAFLRVNIKEEEKKEKAEEFRTFPGWIKVFSDKHKLKD